jgi:hypothetical protein
MLQIALFVKVQARMTDLSKVQFNVVNLLLVHRGIRQQWHIRV